MVKLIQASLDLCHVLKGVVDMTSSRVHRFGNENVPVGMVMIGRTGVLRIVRVHQVLSE